MPAPKSQYFKGNACNPDLTLIEGTVMYIFLIIPETADTFSTNTLIKLSFRQVQ